MVIGLSGLVLGDEGMKAMGAMDTEAMYSAPEAPRYEAAKAAAAVGDSLDQVMFAEGEAESGRLERDLGIGHAPLHHPVHHAPVHHRPIHHAPVHHAPVHHAPLHHTPVHHAPVHHAPVHHKAPLVHAPAPYAPAKVRISKNHIKCLFTDVLFFDLTSPCTTPLPMRVPPGPINTTTG